MILGVLVCFLQAFVFMLLAMVYIGGAVTEHEDHEQAEGERAH
jgi:F0F1-type ATP synthase membrane subunit a